MIGQNVANFIVMPFSAGAAPASVLERNVLLFSFSVILSGCIEFTVRQKMILPSILKWFRNIPGIYDSDIFRS